MGAACPGARSGSQVARDVRWPATRRHLLKASDIPYCCRATHVLKSRRRRRAQATGRDSNGFGARMAWRACTRPQRGAFLAAARWNPTCTIRRRQAAWRTKRKSPHRLCLSAATCRHTCRVNGTTTRTCTHHRMQCNRAGSGRLRGMGTASRSQRLTLHASILHG